MPFHLADRQFPSLPDLGAVRINGIFLNERRRLFPGLRFPLVRTRRQARLLTAAVGDGAMLDVLHDNRVL